MANRFNRKNPNMGMGMGQRRFNNYDNFSRPRYNVNPWQGGVAPNSGGGPSASNSDATIALASNLLNNILQSRQNPMPSLLDLNVRRDFHGHGHGHGHGHNYMRDERYGPGPNKIGRNMQTGGQTNRRINAGGRNDRGINKIRRPVRPNAVVKPKSAQKVTQEIQEAKTTESEIAQVIVKTENGDVEEPTNVSNAEDKKVETPKKNEGVKTEFDGILQDFLECHICEKKMWDGRSFDNHIKGRVHNIMMDKTKQSYMMTADAMRQELKINEMKRNKRGFAPGAKKVFCAMCDLFVYHAAAHRRSPGHQKLKKYLHPSCNTCRKEFPTRIELDEHRLTAPHLLLLQEKQKDVQSRPKPEVIIISTLQDELAQVRTMHEMKQKKNKKENENEGNVNESAVGENEDSETKTEDGEKVDAPEENVLLLLDYKEGDDLTTMTRENLPKYQTERPVGMSFIAEFSCMHCTLCKKFFDTDETAEVHLRTWKHFQSYIRLIHSKGNFKANSEGAVKRDLPDDDTAEEEVSGKRAKVENEGENLNEEELLNGTADEEPTLDQDAVPEDSILGNDSELSTSIVESLNTTVSEEVIPELEVAENNESPTVVQIEQPRPVRGRGRGRGPRSRRSVRY